MMVPEETPLERAGREEAQGATARAQDSREEREADTVVADINAYVAETNPAALPAATEALNAWEIPTDPLDEGAGAGNDEDLVAVFSAQSEAEAAIVRGILESQGIPTTLDGLPTGILGNVFQAGEDRWGDILVPAGQSAEAREVIAAAQSPATEGNQTTSS